MNKYLTAFYIFGIFFFIYWLGSFDKIPFGDCIGFVLMVENNDWQTTATPLSHFLYANIVIFLHQITSMDAKAISKLFVVISSAVCLSVFYLVILSWTKKKWVSVCTTFVLGFSFTFWRNAEIVEVYTFYAIWIALYCLFFIKFWKTQKPKYLILASIFYGASYWVHIMSITILPGFLLLLLLSDIKTKTKYFCLGIFTLFFSSLFILNVIQGLPFNAVYSSGKFNWVGNSFLKSFLQYFKDFSKAAAYLFYNFNIFSFLGIFGFFKLYQNDQKLFWILFISAIGNFGFGTIYAVTDNYVFFFPFNIIFAILIGYGLLNSKWKKIKYFSYSCLLIPFFYILSFHLSLNTKKGIDFNHLKSYKGGIQYYLIPWLNNNVGIVEITIDNRKTLEDVEWMKEVAQDYIKIKQSKGFSLEEIKNQ